jgi:galactose mutarotase-like enzyme
MLIEIQNQYWKATVDTFGGELISLKDRKGIDYLWGGDEKYWVGRSPHLFPIIGTLKENRTRIYDKYYSMNKHGFARNSEFKVCEKTDQRITLVLKDNKNTQEVYPFRFSFYITHTFIEKGFTTNYKIVNEDDKPMFFNLGGHVGVRCPVLPKESFEEYEIVFDQKMTKSAYFPPDDNPIGESMLVCILSNSDTLPLSYRLFEKGALIIDQVDSHKLQLRHRENGTGISFVYEGFPVLALWTFGIKKAPYLCLEPWHGLPAMDYDTIEFKEKPYIITLNPKEAKCLQYALTILD